MLNTVETALGTVRSRGLANPLGPDFARPIVQRESSWQTNELFIGMLNAYRPSGGLARAQEVAAKCHPGLGISKNLLANWMFRKKIICFEWQSIVWLPLFQFKLRDMTLQPGLGDALSELVGVLDDWAIAHWFSQPSPWLDGVTPADAWATSATAVVHAARAERYVALG